MLFMVIERFKGRDARPVGKRFEQKGRLLPAGVTYKASWVDPAGLRCFQLMEAPDPGSLLAWTRQWEDLVEFEIVPVETSTEFWAKIKLD